MLSETAEVGDSEITLLHEVDWSVGDEIVVAATYWNHLESE